MMMSSDAFQRASPGPPAIPHVECAQCHSNGRKLCRTESERRHAGELPQPQARLVSGHVVLGSSLRPDHPDCTCLPRVPLGALTRAAILDLCHGMEEYGLDAASV